jgi:hypothetical protein
MEGMRVRVQSAVVHADGVHAVVIAVSLERILGQPRASLTVRLRVENVAGESVRDRFKRAREEALRYLDVD